MFPFWSSRAWPFQQPSADAAWSSMMQTPQMATPMMPSPQAQFCGPDPMTSQSQAQIQNALNQQNALLHQNIQAQYMTHLHHLQQLQANQSSPRPPNPQPSSTSPSQSNPPLSTPTPCPSPTPTPSQPPSTATQDTSHHSPDTQELFEKVTKTLQAGFKAVAESNAERHHPQPPATVHPQQMAMPDPQNEERLPAACPTLPHSTHHTSHSPRRVPSRPINNVGLTLLPPIHHLLQVPQVYKHRDSQSLSLNLVHLLSIHLNTFHAVLFPHSKAHRPPVTKSVRGKEHTVLLGTSRLDTLTKGRSLFPGAHVGIHCHVTGGILGHTHPVPGRDM